MPLTTDHLLSQPTARFEGPSRLTAIEPQATEYRSGDAGHGGRTRLHVTTSGGEIGLNVTLDHAPALSVHHAGTATIEITLGGGMETSEFVQALIALGRYLEGLRRP